MVTLTNTHYRGNSNRSNGGPPLLITRRRLPLHPFPSPSSQPRTEREKERENRKRVMGDRAYAAAAKPVPVRAAVHAAGRPRAPSADVPAETRVGAAAGAFPYSSSN